MGPTDTAAGRDAGSPPLSAAQARIVAAALELFAQHGVGGTSLGMIAKSIGVTKAAVFHQFRTKDEIILAAAEAEVARLEQVLQVAEAEPSPERAREVLVTMMVDLAITGRRTVTSILRDPVIIPFFTEQERFRHVMQRLSRLLEGPDTDADARVPAAVLMAAISGAVMHPLVAGLDDDTLRSQLMRMAGRLFDLPQEGSPDGR